MSERLPTPEQIISPEKTVEKARSAEKPKAAEYSKAEQDKQVETAQAIVAVEADKAERPIIPSLPPEERPHFIDRTVKRLRMRQNLSHVQTKLKPAEKRLSKVIHQPLVQTVSESAGATVARPSGLLGGGMMAFLGSSVYLWLAHHYDLSYNYTFFFLFLIAGFTLGLAGEYVLYLLHKARR